MATITSRLQSLAVALALGGAALLGGAQSPSQEGRRPHVLFLIGDEEYSSGETVPEWVKKELAGRGVRATFVIDDPKQPATLAGLETLAEADALFISLKRRALTPKQFAVIRKHLDSGKPIVGIRTASHAFGAKKPEPGRAAWDTFDRDAFGGHYQNHYGKGPATLAHIHSGSGAHPIVTGLPTNGMKFSSHLYKCRDLAPGTAVLLGGRVEGKPDIVEPLAWIYTNANHRAFYTSLGSPDDFKEPAFRRLLLNAMVWSVGQPSLAGVQNASHLEGKVVKPRALCGGKVDEIFIPRGTRRHFKNRRKRLLVANKTGTGRRRLPGQDGAAEHDQNCGGRFPLNRSARPDSARHLEAGQVQNAGFEDPRGKPARSMARVRVEHAKCFGKIKFLW